MFKKITVGILIIVTIAFSAFTASAEAATSYSRVDIPGNTTELRFSREMYVATKEISASSFGFQNAFEGITDIFCNDINGIYLLCGENSELIHINSDYSAAKKIVVKDINGEKINYKGAKGVYCDNDGNIYIADTSNARILIADKTGVVKKELNTPDSDLIPSDFLYQPAKIAKDAQGYTYILSVGCYYGALLYTPEYEFMGFYGSNTVGSSALDTLSYMWDKLTSNETKKSVSVKKLPYSFTDFSFDPKGYMVTCTGAISSSVFAEKKDVGQIKKISNNGANILYKRDLKGKYSSSSGIDFLEKGEIRDTAVQELVSIDISDDNYIFALDRGKGFVYIYDTECNLMSAFGGGYGDGKRLGNFVKPEAVALNGNAVLVADVDKYSITVFEPTEYGNLLRKAQTLFLSGDYEEAKDMWSDVLSLNRNCQLAYRGLAMVYYSEGDYHAAMDAAEIAVDYYIYDLAWNEIVSNYIGEHFLVILIIIAVVVCGIILLVCQLRKRKKKLITNKKILLLLRTPLHPFNSFEELKYKKQGSMKIAIIITVLFYVFSVLNVTSTGFLYSTTLLRNYNSLYTLASTVGLVILWSLCNWLVCSMFSGKGTFKEVYIVTSYSLLPWILFLCINVIFSKFLPLAYSGIISGLGTVLLFYTLFLLVIGMITVHEYDFFKFLLTGIVIIFFMILIVFVILLCGILIAQLGSFIVSVFEELVHR